MIWVNRGRLRWKASIVRCCVGGRCLVLRLGLQIRRVERGDRSGGRTRWDYITVMGVIRRSRGGLWTWDEE